MPEQKTTKNFPTTKPKAKKGKLEGNYWVWPDGRMTHMTFVNLAVRRMRPLPYGFYEEIEKYPKLRNLNFLVKKAKSMGLKCTVKEP